MQKVKQAWLITWESAGDHTEVADKVIAIVSGRKSQSAIRDMVEQLWASRQLAWFEQISYAKNRGSPPYHAEERARFEGQVMCGHNPWIEANRVHDLEAYIDEDGREHLQGKHWRPTANEDGVDSKFVPFHIVRELDGSTHCVED